MVRRLVLLTTILVSTWSATAQAFVPPPCAEDSSRTIFAGAFDGPCQNFNGDQASCELAYYLNRGGETASCAYVAGTCVGCGGENGVCTANTCSGDSFGSPGLPCIGDLDRTAIGIGDNGSRRCRNLDNTDQATCESTFYLAEEDDDDDAGISGAVACFWSSGDGSCVGCGDDGNICPFNVCNPNAQVPDAECPLDSGKTNLLGFGGNDSRRCRQLDGTDLATCEASFYEDADSGLPVACWWDGNDCRGSGFDDYFAWNTCLSTEAPPVATATCPLDPNKTNLLGFGTNDTGPCRQLDDTDQATCEAAFYEDSSFGSPVACWWNGGDCRGSFEDEDYSLLNSCRRTVEPATATCPDRSNRLGFGHNGADTCRQLDGTDEATCEDAFYESAANGTAVACAWNGGDCQGCSGGGTNSNCTDNPCLPQTCPGDMSRTFIGPGSNHTGDTGGACKQVTDEGNCDDSFYLSLKSGRGVACAWDGSEMECDGTTRDPENDACRIDAVCTREPGRTRLGFGGDGQQPCRALDGSDAEMCEDAFYEDSESGEPVACYWAAGESCLGSGRRDALNTCVREPLVADATCPNDETRTVLIGFGADDTGRTSVGNTSACRAFDDTDEATCESAYYEHLYSGAAVACWWDEGDCRGTSDEFATQNTCLEPIDCPLDEDRETFLGLGSTGSGDNGLACRLLDGTDEETCEDAFYKAEESATAVACWWNGSECRGSVRNFTHNDCFYSESLAGGDATCGARMTLLGLGNNDLNVCRSLDGTDEGICEDAYYEHDEFGYGVACWWNDSEDECRGSAEFFSDENVCDPGIACYLQPGRMDPLGFGGGGSNLCGVHDGSDQATCENAYYVDKFSGEPVACWWDEDAMECRDAEQAFESLNACLRFPAPTASCGDRETPLGFGRNDNNACRQLDNTSAEACEDAFYVNERGSGPVACVWAAGADHCLGTSRWGSLNACVSPPPVCSGDPGRTAMIGKGRQNPIGQNGGACRQFDNTDEATCENAYYVNRNGTAIGCWWNGDEFSGSCRGTNRTNAELNDCVPAVSCGDRMTIAGYGTQGQNACRQFSGTNPETCEDAYYIEEISGLPVACAWADGNNCLGCGRHLGRGECEDNACNPVSCVNDPGREPTGRCRDISNQSDCENAWHVLGNRDLPPLAASCAWDETVNECFGCGPPSQSDRECANTCEPGCGNGEIDPGETCDDGNMYDGDCCDSTCQVESDGSPCTDRLFCTVGPATCQAGECVGGTPRICATCLSDDCNESSNSCSGERREGDAVAAPLAALQGGAPPPPDMSMPLPPGTACDDGIDGTTSVCNEGGQCVEADGTPTATSTATGTATSTPTATGTTTSTPTITQTPVPVGGPCAETEQCVAGAICLEGFCAVVTAPAPAASDRALLALLLALLGVAAIGLHRRGRQA